MLVAWERNDPVWLVNKITHSDAYQIRKFLIFFHAREIILMWRNTKFWKKHNAHVNSDKFKQKVFEKPLNQNTAFNRKIAELQGKVVK